MDNNNNKSSSSSSSSSNDGRPSLTSSGSVEAVKVNDSSHHQQQQSSELENLVRLATELGCEKAWIDMVIQNQSMSEKKKIEALQVLIADRKEKDTLRSKNETLRKQAEAEKHLLELEAENETLRELEILQHRAIELGCAEVLINSYVQNQALTEEEKIEFLRGLIAPVEAAAAGLKQAEAENETLRKQAEVDQQDLERLLISTILKTYLTKEGKFQLPPLMYNTGVKPSTGSHNRTVTIKDEAGTFKKVTLKIPQAAVSTESGRTWMDPLEVKAPTKSQAGEWIQSSMLGAVYSAYNRRPLVYASEADIRTLCQHIVDDALNALGLLIGSVMTHQEFSIYMMETDIVIVLTFEGRIIFVIEVKSPHTDGKVYVFDNQHVSGQLWSYLWAMKAAGIEVPMGAIMTYDSIVLVTLEDLSDNDNHQSLLAKTREILTTGEQPTYPTKKENQKCDEPKLRPTNKSKHLCEIDLHLDKTETISQSEDSYDSSDDDSGQFTVLEQKVYRSKVYKDGEVFPCLLQAFDVAFQHALTMETKPISCSHPGDKIGGPPVFMLGESLFDWVKLPSDKKGGGALTAKIVKDVPNKQTKSIGILAKIGAGSTAATYVASTGGGRVFAVKDYCFYSSSQHALYKKAQEEHRRWDELYHSRFTTRVATLGAKPCLLMPYGHEILGDKTNCWLAIPAVRTELEVFAANGYIYDPYDLQWHNVLQDKTKSPTNEVFLCGLGYLKKMEKTDNAFEHVYKQLLSLLKVASPEQPNLIETLAWAKSQPDDVELVVNGTETLQQFFDGLTDDESIHNSLKSLFPQESVMSDLSSKAEATLYMLAHFKGLVESNSESKHPPAASPKSETTIRNTMEQDDNGDQQKPLKTAP